MNEISLCVSCHNFNRCHKIVLPAELEAYEMLRKAFRECGAECISFLNIVTKCNNYEK